MTSETNRRPRSVTRRALLGGAAALAGGCLVALGYLASRPGGAIVPGRSRARGIETPSSLPAKVDVVVLGGGNVGCLTALALAERGVKVALCEKGVIAGEASGRSLGFIDSLFLDPVKMEIVARSKRLWENMNARIAGETGYRRVGTAALFPNHAAVEFGQAWLGSVQGVSEFDGRILGAREAAEVAFGSADKLAGALYIPSDGSAEPQLAAPAVAESVLRLGGIVLQNCAVRGLETAGGTVAGVITEKGPIACSAVALAGGVWSPIFLRSLGVDLPQFMAFGSALRFATAPGPVTALVSMQRGLVMRRGLTGSYDACRPVASTPITPSAVKNAFRLRTALENMWDELEPVLNVSTFLSFLQIPSYWPLDRPSPFEAHRILVPETRTDMLDDVAREMQAAFPQIGGGSVIERWAGAMMSTLDNMPVISAVPAVPGLYVASGFYYGLTMGPAAGEALADLVTGRKPQIDLKLYRLSRFSDGTPIKFRA